jgi:hypothetical protein
MNIRHIQKAAMFCGALIVLQQLGSCGNSGPSGGVQISEKVANVGVVFDPSASVNALQRAKPAKPEPQLDPLPDDQPVKLFTLSKRALNENDHKTAKQFEKRLKTTVPLRPIEVDAAKLLELLKRGGILSIEVPGEDKIEVRVVPKPKIEGTFFNSAFIEHGGIPNKETGYIVKTVVLLNSNGSSASASVEIDGREYYFFSEEKKEAAVLVPIDEYKPHSYHNGHPVPIAPPVKGKIEKELNNNSIEKGDGLIKKTPASSAIRLGFVATQLASSAVLPLDLQSRINVSLTYLQEAFSKSAINVGISTAPSVQTIAHSDFQKTTLQVLETLNGSIVPPDIASYRLNNDVDVLVVIVAPQSTRGVTGDAGGYAYIGGNSQQSTIVISSDALQVKHTLAHELGHLLGADHHTLQRTPSLLNGVPTYPDRFPYYGHITPQDPEFTNLIREADIMVDTDYAMFECLVAGKPCRKQAAYSDPSIKARESNLIISGQVSASLCSLQSPFTNPPTPCPSGKCMSYNICPYPLAFGYCFNGISVYKYGVLGGSGTSCYPASIGVPMFSSVQMLGITGQADVASLWKGSRPSEISTFSDQLKPLLISTIATRAQLAFAAALD